MIPPFLFTILQLGLELCGAEFLALETHGAEERLGLCLLARDAGLDLVLAVLVLATAELGEMGWETG